MNIRYPEIEVELVGNDGNAFAIMARVKNAMKRAGVPVEDQKAYVSEATSGDYDNLLQATMRWVKVY